MHLPLPSSDIINATTSAIIVNNYRKSLSDVKGELVTHHLLQAKSVVSDGKYIAYAQIYNIPRMKPLDENGKITSRGKIKHINYGIQLSKEGSALDSLELDYASMQKSGANAKVYSKVAAVALDYVWQTDTDLVNNLDTGKYTCINGEVPAMLTRPADSYYTAKDGVTNLAPNMTGSAFSADAVTLNYSMLGQQKDKDELPIKNNVWGIIVDRSKYAEVKEYVGNSQHGTDLEHRTNTQGLLVGLADFDDPNTWVMIASGMNMGTATIRGRALPYIHTVLDPEVQNVSIITQWVHKNYVIEPYGFILNKPGA